MVGLASPKAHGRDRSRGRANGSSRTSSASTTRRTCVSAISIQLERLAQQFATRDQFLAELALDPPAVDRRSLGHAVPRRGLSDSVDGPFGERTGMGRGVHPERRRWKFPVRVLDGPVGSNRGRAASAVCRDDAREERSAPDRAAEILRGQPAEERRPPRLRRAQPIPDEGGDGDARRDHVARKRRSAQRARVDHARVNVAGKLRGMW